MLSSPVPAKAESSLRVIITVGSIYGVTAQPEVYEARVGMFMTVVGLIVLLAFVVLGCFASFKGITGLKNSLPRTEARQSLDEQELQDPLREREERTGLTLVQRARLRRQLQEGGIVDPPVMYQRYGSMPPWLTVSRLGEGQQQPQSHNEGSTNGGAQVRDGGSISSAPQVQVGGSSGSSDPMPFTVAGQPNALRVRRKALPHLL